MSNSDNPQIYIIGIVDDGENQKTSIASVLEGYFTKQKTVTILPFKLFRRPDAHGYGPACYDFDLLYNTLLKLKNLQPVELPTGEMLSPSEVMIIEGLLALHDSRVRQVYDMTVYVDLDNDVRLSSIIRNALKTSSEIEPILSKYLHEFKPVLDGVVKSQRAYADSVLIGGLHNMDAVRLLVDRIAQVLMLSLSRSNSPRREVPLPVLPHDEN